MFRFDDLRELAQCVLYRLSGVLFASEDQPAFRALVFGAGLEAVEIDFHSGLTPWTMKGNLGHGFLRIALLIPSFRHSPCHPPDAHPTNAYKRKVCHYVVR